MLEVGRWSGAKASRAGRNSKDREYIDLTAGGIFSCHRGPSWNGFRKALDYRPVHCYSHRFKNPIVDRYKRLLQEVTGFTSFVTYTSGTEAVEAFLRVAWAYTGKSGIWGGLVDPDLVGTDKPPCDQFHGWTLGSRILAGRITWEELGVYPELGALRFGNAANATACMGMEPYHAPSGQFHKTDPTINRIVTLQKEFPDILFLIDEIQGGMGRTGSLFAHDHYKVLKPHFVTLGKLVGGGFPLSVLCGPAEIMDSKVVQEHAYLHSTHSDNPLGCSVGILVLEDIIKYNLIERSHRVGLKMHELLKKLPVRVHGKGLMAGIELENVEEADKVVDSCEKRHVLVVKTGRKWVKIGPCLDINEDLLENGLNTVMQVVREVYNARVESPKPEGTVKTHIEGKSDLETRGDTGAGPQGGGQAVQEVRFQAGVERAVDGDQNDGPVGSDDRVGQG